MSASPTEPRKPLRLWPRFSLRTLLVAVLVASVPLGWVARRFRQVRKQREAVQEIARHGGTAMQCHLLGPSDDGDAYCPNWLRQLLDDDFFTSINYVSLSGPSVTDREIDVLQALPEMRSLTLTDCGVTDEGLSRLKSSASLESLSVEGSGISDRGLIHVVVLPHLEYLSLSNTPVTDVGLAKLRRLSRLQLLRVDGTKVTDDGLVHLKAFRHLETLSLDNTQITDAGLAHLRELPALRDLYLENTRVTDEGVAELQRTLKVLRINR